MTRPYDTKEYRAARAKVRGQACRYCGAPPPSTAHHVRSVRMGGANDITNIVPACQSCNNRIAHLERRHLPAIPSGVRRVLAQRKRQVNRRFL